MSIAKVLGAYTYQFIQAMRSSRNGWWSVLTIALARLLMVLLDHIVGVFFYVVARESETEGHVWLFDCRHRCCPD
jgi:hypothetical protein